MMIRTSIGLALLFMLSLSSTAQDITSPLPGRDSIRNRNEKRFDPLYHSQIVSIAPLQFSENGFGFSVGFERAIDRAEAVAWTVPFVVTFSPNQVSDGVKYRSSYDPMFYLMPGIKFYTGGSRKKVAYSVGPLFVVGMGRSTIDAPVYAGDPVTRNRFVFGTLVNNGININATEHIDMCLDFGIGFTYIHKLDGLAQPTRFLTQGSFKIGYRL